MAKKTFNLPIAGLKVAGAFVFGLLMISLMLLDYANKGLRQASQIISTQYDELTASQRAAIPDVRSLYGAQAADFDAGLEVTEGLASIPQEEIDSLFSNLKN